MKSGSAPAAPDPKDTANAQAQANAKAATTQQMINMVDQSTPYGSLSYAQNGYWYDDKGKAIAPKMTATTSLSPEEKAKQEQQWKFDSIVNNLGISQAEKLTGLLDTPLKLDNEATESRLFELGRKRLDPMFEQQRAALETRLANQGIAPGTEAWDKAMTAHSQSSNDAYNQLLLSGRSQALNELLTERNQPINETTALMAGGQVQQPGFTSTPTASVGAPDIGGMTYQSYQMGPLAQWQAEQQKNNALMSGMFQLGGAALGGWSYGAFKMPKAA